MKKKNKDKNKVFMIHLDFCFKVSYIFWQKLERQYLKSSISFFFLS